MFQNLRSTGSLLSTPSNHHQDKHGKHYHSISAQKELARLLANSSQVGLKVKTSFLNLNSVLKLTSVLGLGAILILLGLFFNPSLATQFHAISPFSTNQSEVSPEIKAPAPNLAMIMATPKQIAQAEEIDNTKEAQASTNYQSSNNLIGNQKQQRLVTHWLSKRYRVAHDAVDMLASAAYLTANETKLDPLLILSVMAIESRFNPFSESPVGAQGLMQVMSKIHHEKFSELGGVKAALNPVANIKVGAIILKECIARAGSIEAGLKHYVGAAEHETDGGYGHLVLSEYRRLKDVAAGKAIPIYTSPAKPTIVARPQLPPIETIGEEVGTNTTPNAEHQIAGL